MDNVPLRVLSFFCLSMLYLITFIRSLWTICKFPSFIAEAKIAKWFYVTIFVLCLVRSTCFGIVTVVFVDALVPSNSTSMVPQLEEKIKTNETSLKLSTSN